MPLQVDLEPHVRPRVVATHEPVWVDGLLCGCLTVLVILCSYPVAEMGFFDDWSYVKTAFEYARTGHFVYNGWGAMMLGWQVAWAALFIKAFGYSFTAVRASMLPIDLATVWLFHTILIRFSISRSGARFGALTLGLSPLFIPLGASFMTDISGLFAILSCLYLCLRALDAETDNAALIWLCAAALASLIGGTARQIAWLGALVLVPPTAWLMSRTPRLLVTAALLWFSSLGSVVLLLLWWSRQPYSVPEKLIQGPVHWPMLINLGQESIRAVLCLAFLMLPLLCLWIPRVRMLSFGTRMAMLSFVSVSAGACAMFPLLPRAIGLPWLQSIVAVELVYGANDVLGAGPFVVSPTGLAAVSILVVVLVWAFVSDVGNSAGRAAIQKAPQCLARTVLLLNPFIIAYVCFLLPRALYSAIYDRYLLGIAPFAIFAVLYIYERGNARKIPRLAYIPLLAIACYSSISTHDLFALDRARIAAVREVVNSGVPENAVQAGFEYDGLTQIKVAGYVNFPEIRVPASAYKADNRYLTRPPQCRFTDDKYFSALQPRYLVVFPGARCGKPSGFPSVNYITWLAPRHRTLQIVEVSQLSTGDAGRRTMSGD